MANNEQRDFHHPYTPYPIQVEFMQHVYDTIENGCVGIFESPTGTGKSLSLICGSLTWLREHKSRELQARLDAAEDDDGEPEWVREYAKQEQKQKILGERKELEDRLKKIRENERKDRERVDRTSGVTAKRMKKDIEVEREADDEDLFILDDYESDDENKGAKRSGDADGLSPAVRELMKKLGMPISGNVSKEEEDTELPEETKIFFCSRTHSQLSQFVNELRRVKLPPSFPNKQGAGVEEGVKHLSLGSRKNLCINPKVLRLNNATAINERCLELQKSGISGTHTLLAGEDAEFRKEGTSMDHRCQFLPSKDDQVAVRDFRDHTLADIRDIEDIAQLGKKMGLCPYYAARSVIKPSEIVTLPYPLLLQKTAREALDISLKGNIIIIDEAHNLIEAISSIHSITVTLSQLQRSKTQVAMYLNKFKNRLKGKNKIYIMQTLRLLEALASVLEQLGRKGAGEVPAGELLAAKGIDQVNFFKLQRYLVESKLARKVEGYVVHFEQKEEQLRKHENVAEKKPSQSVPVLTHLQGFLMALTNPATEGKIFYGRTDMKELFFKYMLLDPAFHFKCIVEEAKAVILAGGTMQPMSDYMTHLFPYLPKEKIKTLSCGHVIPKENLLAWPVVKGPSGRDLEFTFEQRKDPDMIEDLGRAIGNLCIAIPHGLVCFFPSYSYLDLCVTQWQKSPPGSSIPSLWERLGQRKRVFRESAANSSVDETLAEYGRAIDEGKGGLLLSVVGGKMSEGINFNDNLGRGVVMIGLPFPNAHSVEWRVKLEHVEKVAYENFCDNLSIPAATLTTPAAVTEAQRKAYAKSASREFYENACMRAVNQSIGRAIRHREDYAAIILLDRRYATERIQNKLPGWIRTGLVRVDAAKGEGKFVDTMKSCGAFFRSRRG